MTNIMAAALALAVALVPSLVDAQPGCRSECGAMFRQCQQSCVGADERISASATVGSCASSAWRAAIVQARPRTRGVRSARLSLDFYGRRGIFAESDGAADGTRSEGGRDA